MLHRILVGWVRCAELKPTCVQNLASLLLQSRWHVSDAQDGGAEGAMSDKWALEEKAEKLLLQAIDIQPEHFPSLAQYAQLRKLR